MVYVVFGQAAAILPSAAAAGAYDVRITVSGRAGQPFRTSVVDRAYGMVTLNSVGKGPVVIQSALSATELQVNQFTAPARPGQVMILWGTGLGPVRVPDNNAPGAQDFRGEVTVRVLVGGVEITPDYAGRSPSLPGTDQINFTLPPDVPQGCFVPIQVRVGDTVTAAPTSLSIASGGRNICEHPLLTDDMLRRLDARQSLTLGFLTLESEARFGPLGSLTPQAGGGFPGPPGFDFTWRRDQFRGRLFRYSLANIHSLPIIGRGQESVIMAPVGACALYRGRIGDRGSTIPYIPSDNANFNLSENFWRLSGPGVPSFLSEFNGDTTIGGGLGEPGDPSTALGGVVIPDDITAPIFRQGDYTVSPSQLQSTSGIASFTARISVPAPFKWTNRASIENVNRSSPLTVNWTGGGGAANQLVSIVAMSGSVVREPLSTIDDYDMNIVACTARSGDGSFTIPTSALRFLPATSSLSAGAIGTLSVRMINALDNGRLTAPLRAGGNLDYAVFGYSLGWLRGVTYQ